VSNLNTWKRGDQWAVHKPLLALMLIARAASHESRRMPFATIVDDLTTLLKAFGPRRLSDHPELPFWHLQSDGFWEVEDRANFPLKKGGHSPTRHALLAQEAVGAVPQPLWNTLQHSDNLRAELTQQLLDAFWPSSMHEAIRRAIGRTPRPLTPLDLGSTEGNMSFWWVNHSQTHRGEIEGGYIWSPKQNRNGARNETYLNLTRACPADLIFSDAAGEIGAVGIIEAASQECDRPLAFGKTGEQWDPDGWRVPVDWCVLTTPVVPKRHLDVIRPLLPATHAPMRPNGEGNQGCYLAEIGDALGVLLLQLVQGTNPGLRGALDDARQALQDAREEARLAAAPIPETEKAQLIKARRGQGLFRLRVEAIESRRRLTHTSDRRFLAASHLKPWRLSKRCRETRRSQRVAPRAACRPPV
jgi:putative restriction endonuclease